MKSNVLKKTTFISNDSICLIIVKIVKMQISHFLL